ncbi:hypothetical protein EPUS_08311 [Endocarpon pusillum Z07020]|uniref:Ig-like domain-containing protein n=1 Tax=Endocarpon pusillum (strain Z07020 / HMAS-L-300199) TaxID=1263415 RepID=U1GD27_ENDPU|nr:uncharacterized protein EPUS_08311 [Endocarpon pusillum Z07020]ERF75497.1 hypothetical protein EPUS_08311 [Endocarpon pusillum Z07020]
MKSAIALALIGVTYTSAQVEYINGSFVCAVSDANYCAGDSLSTNIIIRCTGTEGQPGNCNDNLAGIPPVGVKSSATCYQSSPSAGDAACSFDGNVYPEDDGSGPFPVPSRGDDHSSAADTSSYGGSMTTVISHYTTGTVTNTYTVTVPCPTTTTAAPSPPTGSPTPNPSATTCSSPDSRPASFIASRDASNPSPSS